MTLHDRSSSLTEAVAWCSIINLCKAELNWKIKCLYLLLSSKHRLPHNPPASSGSVSGSGHFCPFCCFSDLFLFAHDAAQCQFQGISGSTLTLFLWFSAICVSSEPFPQCNKCVRSTFAYYNLQILITLPAVIAPGIILNYLCCHKYYTLHYLDNICF